MSAIAGIYHFNKQPVPVEHIHGMMGALRKFPADDIRVMHRDNLFLGCHAQWITPESIGEILPYYDHERQLAITADCIIDNRDELFEHLQVKKEHRKTMSDSELILLSYYKWGEECPKYLVGDFAFMIWDEKQQKLFGARDFSGARTLYYYKDHQRFGFCTTIAPLLAMPYVEKKLNENWLAEFIANPGMFESIDISATVYKTVQQLPPSHSITVHNGKATLSRYSTLTEGDKLKLKTSADYEEAFCEVFQTAVSSKLRTHKKVGAHLSGGLDSGSVASFAAKALHQEGKQLHTFSYVPVNDFVDWTHKTRIANERPLIESTVNYVGNISPNYLSFENRSPYSEIDEWLETIEMPYKFFENTFWLRGMFEEASNQGAGILLNGQRGNWTISWGPTLDYYALLIKRMKWIKFYQELNLYSHIFGAKKKRVISAINKKLFPSIFERDIDESSYFPIFINKEFALKNGVMDRLNEHGIDTRGIVGTNSYKIRMEQFQKLYYWNTTGTYGSKFSLRYGIKDRDPTNDLRVVRFCLSIPEEQYVQNGVDRSLIRRSTKDYLPKDIRLNMKTRGVQGADGVHRMKPIWNQFLNEIDQMKSEPIMRELIDLNAINNCLSIIKSDPQSHLAFEFEFKVLMRSMILYRFIKNI